MALAIDGTGSATPSTVTTGSTVALTTTQVGDIIVVFIGSEVEDGVGGPAANVANVTATGLTFTRRGNRVKIDQNSSFHFTTIECWWAYSPGAFVGNITVDFNKQIDDAVLIACGVSGFTGTTYQTQPWDSNASLPRTTTDTPATDFNNDFSQFDFGGAMLVGELSTTAANTMVLGFFGTVGSGPDFNPAQGGFTELLSVSNTGAVNQFTSITEYHNYTTPQTNIAVAIGTSTNIGWMIIADALSMSGSSAPPVTTGGASLFAGSGLLRVDGTFAPIHLVLGSSVLDGGLALLDTNADKVYVCSRQPTTFTEATSTFALGNKNLGAGNVFPGPAAGSPSGRKITSVPLNGGTVTANGIVSAWAVVDSVNSSLLASGNLTGAKAVVSGQVWSLESIVIHMASQ